MWPHPRVAGVPIPPVRGANVMGDKAPKDKEKQKRAAEKKTAAKDKSAGAKKK